MVLVKFFMSTLLKKLSEKYNFYLWKIFMKNIYLVTGNEAKRRSFLRALDDVSIDMDMVDPEAYGIIEPQMDDVTAVAQSKAEQVWSKLKKPCLVEDGGLYIPALNGFPGAFSKYALATLTVDGFYKLMQDVDNRKVYFKGAIYYINAKGEGTAFVGESHGTFADYIANPHPKQWSEAWRIFIPEGFDKTLSELTSEEFEEYHVKQESDVTNRWKKLREHLLNE
jgi:XTP/dITP diphosphohydrolase